MASAAFSGLLTVVTTVAPDQRASWIAALPTAPAPPATSTVIPSRAPGPSRVGPPSMEVSARCAVTAGTPSDAPRSYDALVGQRHHARGRLHGVLRGGAVRPLVLGQHQPDPVTDRESVDPGADRVDDAGAVLAGRHLVEPEQFCRRFQSVGFTPARTSRTRTSPGPGSGSSRSTRLRTEDGPVSVKTTARMLGASTRQSAEAIPAQARSQDIRVPCESWL